MQPSRGRRRTMTDGGVARCVGTAILLALVLGSSAVPANAASPAVQAATAGGTPVINPPKRKPKPFTCTPKKKTGRCTKTAVTCKTISGVKTCIVKKVTCKRVGKYKTCVITTSTCRTIKSKKTGKSKRTCRPTSRKTMTLRISASIASGPIARFTLHRSPRSTTLVSTTTAAAPPVASAVATPGPTVPPGAGIGVLVLVLALVGLTVTRRPRSRG